MTPARPLDTRIVACHFVILPPDPRDAFQVHGFEDGAAPFVPVRLGEAVEGVPGLTEADSFERLTCRRVPSLMNPHHWFSHDAQDAAVLGFYGELRRTRWRAWWASQRARGVPCVAAADWVADWPDPPSAPIEVTEPPSRRTLVP